MNKKKLLIIIILSIFVAGMVLAPASAAHSVKIGKYKAKMSDKQYKKIKNAKKKGKMTGVTLKTNKKGYKMNVENQDYGYYTHGKYLSYNSGGHDKYHKPNVIAYVCKMGSQIGYQVSSVKILHI